MSAEEWLNLYDRLIDTDLRPANSRLVELTKLVETNTDKVTRSNVVPIGLINMEGIYLSEEELAKNEASKKAKRAVDFTKYETVRIVSAAVLQEDLYQAKVSFFLNKPLNINNHAAKVTTFEIDFNDGKGFKSYPIMDQLILHEFQSVGEHRINIRFQVGSVTYTFETKVNVKQMVRYPYEEFDITAKRFSTSSSEADSTARTVFVGGTIRIIKGCDEILDKPILIAEGFDMGQDVNLDVLEARYRTPLNQFLLEGYDLVFLNYNDGRAAIQDNAQVLKAALEVVNTQKTGNIESIVIGESMSGLVARWALREMENAGQPHHVRLLLCYDTPHQGANVPVGVTNVWNVDQAQSPFAAVYGTNENTKHVNAGSATFIVMGLAEGLLTADPACPALPVPPIPTVVPFNTCYPFGQKRTTEDNTANITVSLKNASNGQYVHNWTVLPSNQYFTTTGDQITFQAERVDHYEVTCVRTYPNRRDLSSTSKATIWVYDCNNVPAKPDEDQLVFADAADVWEGDFLLTTAVDSLAVFAHYFPVTKILYASLQNGTFIPRSKLKASGMFDEFAALFAENDPSNPLPVHLVKFEARAEGKNVLLTWSTSSEINSEKFIPARKLYRSYSVEGWD